MSIAAAPSVPAPARICAGLTIRALLGSSWEAMAEDPLLRERAASLARGAGERGRMTIAQRIERLRSVGPAIVQTAAAAALAWVLAKDVIGHPKPFFAPVSAIIALGVVLDSRTRRAFEIVLGVAVGVAVADAVVLALGAGWWQIALVVALAMTVAVVLGGRRVIIGQAATSAVLVATISVPSSFNFTRPVDALVGGTAALVVHLVILPVDPRWLVRRRLGPLLADLASVLDRVASAVATGNRDAAEDVLLAARDLDGPTAAYAHAVDVGLETATLAPLRRSRRPELQRHAIAARHLDLAVRNVRVLARGAVRAVDLEANVPDDEIVALGELSAAVRGLPPAIEHATGAAEARRRALDAADHATRAFEQTGNLSLSVLTGQIRSVATDLLRAIGEDSQTARAAVVQAGDGSAG